MTMLPFHPLANVFPLMDGREFDELVADIRQHGLREPIVTFDGQVLDGRNRMRACALAEAPYRLEPFSGDDPVAFVVSMNLRRRHLDESQRSMVAAKLETMKHGGDRRSGNQDANLHVDRADAARMLNVSTRGVASAKAVLDHGTPALVEKVERGQVSVSAAADVARLPEPEQREIVARGEAEIIREANRLKRERKEANQGRRAAEVASAAANIPEIGDRYWLYQQPCRRGNVDSGSIDLIVTDPPYPQEFLPVYADLADLATDALKDGGLAIVMVGQTYLPTIMELLGRELCYHWTLAYLTPGGQATQQFPRKVNTFWKPVLVYAKGAYAGEWFGDVASSDTNDNDKSHHYWGQSVSGMRDLMRRFVRPGMKVLDPFLGGGTTAVVALELGAYFRGGDIDAKAIETTKARIGEMNAAMVA